MSETFAQAFERLYDVEVYPEPPKTVVLTKGVHAGAEKVACELGLRTLDLRSMPPAQALLACFTREGAYGDQRVAALVGRDALDKALQATSSTILLRAALHNGLHAISRFGNGVNFKVQDAFDNGGTIVERTPRGNAEAVRIYQSLILLLMLHPDSAYARENNPVAVENEAVKSGHVKKSEGWDRRNVTRAVNPESKGFDEAPEEARKCSDFLRGKKVAVIGLGVIGTEVVKHTPFLHDAKVYGYDRRRDLKRDGVTVTDDMDEALQDADLVLLHLDGNKPLIGARELALLKKGAMICNFARGKVIEPTALLNALHSGQIDKAGLDTHWIEEDELLKKYADHSEESERCNAAKVLRMHERVIATNHSGASDEVAQLRHVEDGLPALHRYLTRGEIDNCMNAPNVEFPRDAFVRTDNGSGVFVPRRAGGAQMALELVHDGDVAEVLDDARIAIKGLLEGGKLNRRPGKLYHQEAGERVNGVDFYGYELPPGKEPTPKLFEEIAMRASSVDGIRRARVFHVKPKTV